jgi:hypothetical protein
MKVNSIVRIINPRCPENQNKLGIIVEYGKDDEVMKEKGRLKVSIFEPFDPTEDYGYFEPERLELILDDSVPFANKMMLL